MKKIIIAIILIFTINCVNVSAISVSAEYACVIERDSAEIVYSKNANVKYPMASTTKIMTALIALENSDMTDIVTASKNAASQEGSSIYLRANDRIHMEDLIYGLMLNSGNDAAVAIAEHIAGNTEEFAKMMTKRANEIGAVNTQFKNPNGLDADGHYTTAYDLALITREAMKNPTFREIVSTKSKKVTLENNGADIYLSNHNKMLKIYDGANGVKTGYTRATGRCLVSSAQRNDMNFIAVTLNAPNDWTDHKNMLDYAFNGYERKTVLKKDDVIKTMQIQGGKLEVGIENDVDITARKSGESTCEAVLHLSDSLKAPINKNEKVGIVEIKQNGTVIRKEDIIAKNEIKADEQTQNGGWLKKIKSIFLNKFGR